MSLTAGFTVYRVHTGERQITKKPRNNTIGSIGSTLYSFAQKASQGKVKNTLGIKDNKPEGSWGFHVEPQLERSKANALLEFSLPLFPKVPESNLNKE